MSKETGRRVRIKFPFICLQCKNGISTKGATKFCSLKCKGLYSRGKSKSNYNQPSKTGYIRIRVNGKRRYEHQVNAEQKLGRPLKKGEVVHHTNEIKGDNRPENLEVKQDNIGHLKEHNFWRGRTGRKKAVSKGISPKRLLEREKILDADLEYILWKEK
jgi:hypothetical protein